MHEDLEVNGRALLDYWTHLRMTLLLAQRAKWWDLERNRAIAATMASKPYVRH